MVRKNRILITTGSVALLLMLATPQVINAQSALQQTTPQGTVQPQSLQSSQAQATANTQDQVGSLQENKGETVLSQSNSHALGVVSDPTQIRPDVVVQPSETLSTKPTQKVVFSQKSPIVWVIGLIVLVAGGIYWLGQRLLARNPVAPSIEPVTYTTTEVGTTPRPKKKKRSKKKRTPHQR